MPRTAQANEKIRNQKRKLILRKSLNLFAANGYGAVSIDDIAKSCGISHGLLYHYFKTKEDVLKSLIDIMHEKLNALSRSVDEVDPKLSLTNLLDSIITAIKEKSEPNMAALLYIFLNTHINNEIDKKRNIIFDLNETSREKFPYQIHRLIVKGQEAGCFKEGDPIEYSYAICSMILGLSYVAMKDHNRSNVFPSAEIIMGIVNKE